MDFSGIGREEENGKRGRSFRYEDYNNRRIFLRSYPLQWEDDGEDQYHEQGHNSTVDMFNISNKAKGTTGKINLILKQRSVVFVLGWCENKVLLLRKLKNKLGFYLVACHPFRRKPSPTLLSV